MGLERVILIKDFNIVRIDSKGRIILPYHIRDFLGLKEGAELLILNNERELKLFPLESKKTARIKILLDMQSFSKVLDIFGKYQIDILMSIGKTVRDGKSEWGAIIDTSNCNIKKLAKDLKALKSIDRVEIEKK